MTLGLTASDFAVLATFVWLELRLSSEKLSGFAFFRGGGKQGLESGLLNNAVVSLHSFGGEAALLSECIPVFVCFFSTGG